MTPCTSAIPRARSFMVCDDFPSKLLYEVEPIDEWPAQLCCATVRRGRGDAVGIGGQVGGPQRMGVGRGGGGRSKGRARPRWRNFGRSLFHCYDYDLPVLDGICFNWLLLLSDLVDDQGPIEEETKPPKPPLLLHSTPPLKKGRQTTLGPPDFLAH